MGINMQYTVCSTLSGGSELGVRRARTMSNRSSAGTHLSLKQEGRGSEKEKIKQIHTLCFSRVTFIREFSSCPQTPCNISKVKLKKKLSFSYLIRSNKGSWLKSDTHYTHKHNISHDWPPSLFALLFVCFSQMEFNSGASVLQGRWSWTACRLGGSSANQPSIDVDTHTCIKSINFRVASNIAGETQPQSFCFLKLRVCALTFHMSVSPCIIISVFVQAKGENTHSASSDCSQSPTWHIKRQKHYQLFITEYAQ